MFSSAHLSRYVLLITQAGGVGILSPNTVHGVVYLRSCPAVYLERSGYPLKRVSLDPTAKNTRKICHLFPFVHLRQFIINVLFSSKSIYWYLKPDKMLINKQN